MTVMTVDFAGYEGRHRPPVVAMPRRSVRKTVATMWASFVDWAKIPWRNLTAGVVYDNDPT